MKSDFICRSALFKSWDGLSDEIKDPNLLIDEMIKRTQEAPAVDIEPVRHGRWIMRGGWFRCSVCDAKTLWKRNGGIGGFSYEYEQVLANYCPNCGARMDAKEVEK